MKYERTFNFKRGYKKLPAEAQKAFEKQVVFLLSDIRHPSLRAKDADQLKLFQLHS